MRPNANSRRSRGRGGRKSGNPRNQTFDSNGPGARVRGNASQIFEKYQQLARDAASSGDRVGAENLLQHAEHYYRILNANAPNDQQRSMAPGEDANGMDDNSADEMIEAEASDGNGEAQPNGNGRSNSSRRGSGRRKDPSEEPQPDVAADESPAGGMDESANV